jgi:DNA-binding response OmpR family regulator
MGAPLILLVDPDPDTRVILRSYLEFHRYRVLDCADDETGLALAREHDPDLVIGDLPDDALGPSHFSRALRSYAGSDAPVLVFTARALTDPAERASYGGGALLFKPATPTEVVAEVKRLLDSHRQTSLPSAP